MNVSINELLQLMTSEASYGCPECPDCGGDLRQCGGYEAHELTQYICDDCDYIYNDDDLN